MTRVTDATYFNFFLMSNNNNNMKMFPLNFVEQRSVCDKEKCSKIQH